jgi:hypothetical protein
VTNSYKDLRFARKSFQNIKLNLSGEWCYVCIFISIRLEFAIQLSCKVIKIFGVIIGKFFPM